MSDLQNAFPSLDASACQEIERAGTRIEAPRGAEIFNVGDECQHFIIALDGSVRVQLVAMTGRKILLYRVKRGDTCILTTACLIGGLHYNAEALVETDIKAITIPRAAFSELIKNSESFRTLVFNLFARRLVEIVGVLEGVAFQGVDARLARYLMTHAGANAVAATHSEIAADIGTAREVVSRHLKQFAERGLIAPDTVDLRVKDLDTLRNISEGV